MCNNNTRKRDRKFESDQEWVNGSLKEGKKKRDDVIALQSLKIIK